MKILKGSLPNEVRAYTLLRNVHDDKLPIMAIYHLEGKIISRSQGRSVTAASAYRACEKLLDERTGLLHDFTKKIPDLVFSEILLPVGTHEALKDRQTLWNAVESAEKRKDAQLAREFNISLPKELTDEQNWELAKRFVQTEFVDRGMIADMAFHRGHKSQEAQPHIHVMLTLREILPEDKREPNIYFGQKVRAWNDKGLLNHWREAWANECNHTLAMYGHDMRIDHRTLNEQGINLEPQTKIGAKVAQAYSAHLAEHQVIARANGERILLDPSLVLTALTAQQSTFTHQDIARVVSRYTADHDQFQLAYAKVFACPELVHLGLDEKSRERYTTEDMLKLEKGMVSHALTLANREAHTLSPSTRENVRTRYSLSEDQRSAYDYALASGDMKNIVGFAGTGKSYLLGAVREAYEKEGYQVIGMSMAGKAAENLEDSSQIKSRTVASYFASWEAGHQTLTSKDIVIIDEAGMLDTRQYARLLKEAHDNGAKVISVFDPEQLQPIGAGAAARAVAERTSFVELADIRRQREEWQKEATRDFALGNTQRGLVAYEEKNNVHSFNTKQEAMQTLLDNWQEIRSQHPDRSQLMLAYTRDEVSFLNEGARLALKERGELVHEQVIETSRGKRAFAEGDRVYFLRNDYKELDVKNGTLGHIETLQGDRLGIRLDPRPNEREGRLVELDIKVYNHLDHGYASTLHKAQGSTADYTHLLASKQFDRHLTYVGMTRHTEAVNVYYGRDDFKNFNNMADTLSREKTKEVAFDYASLRGIEPPVERTLKRESSYANDFETQDRLKQSEGRMRTDALLQGLSRAEKNSGLSLNLNLEVGDKGVYRGLVEVEGKRYGVMEISKGEGKLVPQEILRTHTMGKAMHIETTRDATGQEQLRAVRTPEKTHERDRGYSMDM